MLSFTIHNITLLVHYIIIFKQSLTYAKIVFLYFFLCSFNTRSDHAVLNHFTLFIAKLIHDLSDTFTAKHSHQVIFQCNIELGSTGISLSSRTTTKLSVYPSAIVPFGTNDCKPTCFFYTGTKFDIRTTTSHISGYRYSSG